MVRASACSGGRFWGMNVRMWRSHEFVDLPSAHVTGTRKCGVTLSLRGSSALLVVRPSEKRKKVVLLSSSFSLLLAHHPLYPLSLFFFFSSPCPPSLPRTSCSTTRPSSSEG